MYSNFTHIPAISEAKKAICFLFLFTLSLATYSQTQIGADIDGKAANEFSGRSVSMSSDGSTVGIGAQDNGTGTNAGHVRVYKNMSGTWTQIGADINGEAADDGSGFSVSLSSDGSTVAIGAPNNDGTGSNAGHVRVYKNMSGTWTQIGADINGEAASDFSGYSVSLSSDGSTVAIGAHANDGTGSNAGHVRVYKNMSGTWTQIGVDIDGEATGDQSGISVSLSSDGSTVAIGAQGNDGTGSDAGHVRVYKNMSGNWTQIGADIDGEATNDNSGISVSLSSDGSTMAIGASLNDGSGSGAGHVRVYKNMSGTWTQIGADIDGEAADDNSGISVSLSSDGSTVAIGAHNNDGTATSAGHVRVYKNMSGIWTQIGTDINGEAANDRSGISVSLSSTGSTVAIGANRNDGTAINAGHVRVYSLGTAALTVDLSVSSTTSSEASPVDITLTATASAPVSADETVTLTVSGTNITTGDYTLNAMTQNAVTITIPNGMTTGTATFRVVDDNIVEGNETALLSLSNPSSGITLGTTTTQNILIENNPQPIVATIKLNGSSTTPVFLTNGNTATFTAGPSGLTDGSTIINAIPICNSSTSLVIPNSSTSDFVPDNYFGVTNTIENWYFYNIGNSDLSLRFGLNFNASENAALWGPYNSLVEAQADFTDGTLPTAIANALTGPGMVDYVYANPPNTWLTAGYYVALVSSNSSVPGSMNVLHVNASNLICPVPTTSVWKKDNANIAGSENKSTFVIPSISSGDAGSYTIETTQGSYSNISNAIVVNTNPSVNLSVSSITSSEASPTDITVTATANTAVSADEIVTLTVSGTNITTGDYTLNAITQNTVTITILSGNTTGTATFRVVDDAIYEGPTDEIAVLTLSNPSSGITLGSTVTQNITIIENDLPCHPSNIIYVNDDASGANNGTSWTDAFTDLQSALTLAGTCNLVNQIWVAAGTYKPTSTTNRSVYFAMRNNLAIYGGFNGTETSIGARNITANETILSGDIGTIGVATDNSYHIFRNDNLDNTAILNGFTLRDGYGLQSNVFDGYGAAMIHLNSNPIIKNCKFINNQCNRGGACFSNANVAAIVYDSCTFIGNKAVNVDGIGGAINQAANAKITVTNSLFMGNEAAQGGAIYLESGGANVTVSNSVFDNNKATFGGAIRLLSNNTMNITTSIFKNNRTRGSNGGGAIEQNGNGNLSIIEKCQFFDNLAQNDAMTIGTGGAFQIIGTGSATFTNTSFYNNQAIGSSDDGGGHIMIYSGTVNLINCTLAEGNTTSQGGSVSLFNNTCTLNATNTIFSHSTATSSNPVIAKRTGMVNLTNCLFDLPCPTGVTCTGSIVTKDPLYTNVSSNDLTLTACSPAINAGTNTGAPTTDIINTARPQFTTVDVGAYESTVAPLPKASLALSVTTLAENDPSTEQVIVNVDQAVSGPQTIDVTVSGTNITTGDYLLNNMTQSTFTITVPNGSMMSTAAFNIVNDVLPEGTEKAYFTLSNPSSGICIVDPKVDSMILEDNDPIAKNFNTNATYYSLQDAINDAVDGQLIMLLYDISESNLTISNSVIIEADGHLLTIPSGTLSIPFGKSLTWKEDVLFIGPGASIDNDGTLKNIGTINYQGGIGTFTNTGAYNGRGIFQGNFMNAGSANPGN